MATHNSINLNSLKETAEAGDANAQYEMAFIESEYADPLSDSGEDAFKRAFTWLEKAANQGHSDAQLAMGLYFLYKTDRKLMSKRIHEQLKSSTFSTPLMIAIQLLVAKLFESNNDPLGIQWLSKSAKQNNCDAQFWLGYCHYHGFGLESNKKLSFLLFKQAAEQGSSDAMVFLALSYLKGEGVDINDGVALTWLNKAVELSNDVAFYLMGLLHKSGRWVSQNPKSAFKWFEKSAHLDNADAQYILALEYIIGKAVDRDDEKSWEWMELAADNGHEEAKKQMIVHCLKQAANYGSAEAHLALGQCYQQGSLVEKNLDLSGIYFDRSLYLTQNKECGLKESTLATEFLIEIYRLKQDGKIDEETALRFESFFNQFKNNLNVIGKLKKDVEAKNRELLQRNSELESSERELEETMAMFAHKFRSPLDAIIYNTTHEHQPKLYIQAAQTMRGLLDVFSIISTDADMLKDRLKQDCRSEGSLATAFSKTLDMIMLHLLSASAAEKIQQHYMRYAKAQGLCESEIGYKVWNEDYFELERQLQTEWEQSYAQLLNQSASVEQRLDWLAAHFFKLEVRGFDRADIQFKEYGVTESFLTILLNEVLVNAFKYYSSTDGKPVVLEWLERDGYQALRCQNPSKRHERQKLKGSGKGHTFLSALAGKTDSQFSKPKPQDNFVLEFGIPNELLKAN